MRSSDPLPAGPAELLRLKREYLVPCSYHFYREPPQLVRGEGVHLYDSDGRRYLDCFTGVTVMSAGHCVPEIVGAAVKQAATLQHTTSIYLTEPVLRLAEALASFTPGNLRRCFFTASGTEAVEGALLAAAVHTGRQRVVAFDNGLHGRTRWAMNVTGAPMWRNDPFPLEGVTHVPFGDADAVARELAHGDVACVVGEPVQGNGGVNVPPGEFWPRVRELCDWHDTLLAFDEIQTGMSRTGRRWACEHWGVVPDLLCTSKALGNGFPIAAFVTTDAVAESFTRPSASTYGGNPVSAAAALAVLRLHADRDLAGNAATAGEVLSVGLREIAEATGTFAPPRGLGLMLGCATPSAAACDDLLEDLKNRGLLAGKTGLGRDVLTFLPPLTLTPDHCDEILTIVEDAARDAGAH